jgi:hypothetical protein
MQSEAAAHVECFSGHTYAQRPVAFIWQDERCEVSEVEAEWYTAEGKRFWVRTSDGERFELYYLAAEEEWMIQQL